MRPSKATPPASCDISTAKCAPWNPRTPDLLDGFWLNYFWMNETTLSANSDAHCQAQTPDGGAGVYARRADGTLAVMARSRTSTT